MAYPPGPMTRPPAVSEVRFQDLYDKETYEAVTSDGWTLALTRYQARPQPWDQPLLGEPLLMVHGFSQNRHAWTAGDLVKHLMITGLDVHLLELRGHGKSSRALQRDRAGDHGRPLPPDYDYRWDFSDYFLSDVPAGIAAVKRKTGRSKIAYAGHSMGGIIGYGLAAKRQDLTCLAALGSPLEIGAEAAWIRLASRAALLLPVAQAGVRAVGVPGKALRSVTTRLSQGRSPLRKILHAEVVPMDLLLGRVYRGVSLVSRRMAKVMPAQFRLFNPETADLESVAYVLERGEDKEPMAVLKTLTRWVRKREVKCYRSGFDIVANVHKIVIPTLLAYGDADVLAGHRSTGPGFDRLRSTYRRRLRFEGSAHIDMTMGPDTERLATAIRELVEVAIDAAHRASAKASSA